MTDDMLSGPEEQDDLEDNLDGRPTEQFNKSETPPPKRMRTPANNSFPVTAQPSILRSVVKVFVTRSSPNYAQPWQTKVQRSAVGSAFVVNAEERHLLTNAHVIAHNITIHVRRPGHPKKWKALALCEGRACDLALLTVEDDAFWEGIQAVSFLGVPELQQAITVTGYPVGGDSLSITQGIVSRVSMSPYATGAPMLMHIQIDAAINPGNSGGPAFSNLAAGEVVGVAFSKLRSAEATGYIIPFCVVAHFLEEYKRHGTFTGLCCLGMLVQRLENPSLRKFHRMQSGQSGALVYNISPLSAAAQALRVSDVVTHINGASIADDATIAFRHDERIGMSHAIRHLHVDDAVTLDIIRDGEAMSVQYALGRCLYMVPGLHGVDCWPSYYIFGGLVFQPLSQLLLEHFFGCNMRSRAPASLLAYIANFRPRRNESVVVLSQVLASDLTFGYVGSFQQCVSVNGVKIKNLYHLARLLDGSTEDFIKFDLEHGHFVVMNRAQAVAEGPEILQSHGIAEDRSKDLKDRGVLPETAKGLLAGAWESDSE